MLQLSLDDIRAGAERAQSGGMPPVERWNPPLSGDIDIRIARDGSWYHEGDPIARLELVQLFASLLKREEGEYFLVTPVEKWRIQVEDAPFLIVACEVERDTQGEQRLVFTTNTGDQVVAGPDHPLRVSVDPVSGEPSPYVLVRRNLEALLSRAVFYQLADLVEPGPAGTPYGVTSRGVFFPLG